VLLPQLLTTGGSLVCDSCNSGKCIEPWDLLAEDWHIMTDHTPYDRKCCFVNTVEDSIRNAVYVPVAAGQFKE